jgi:sugar lactone lactonase YvrE
MRFSPVITVCAAVAAVLQSVNAQAPTSTVFNPVPSRIVGQAVLQQQGLLTANAPNLVEGREFNGPQALALDTSATPPILYVADTGNNRVLAWKNASGFTKGNFADKVIGQRDFLSTAAQGPGTNLSTGLAAPDALAVDKAGNLYVVDAGNNRILRYPAPLSQTGALLTVDLIIGQKDLNGRSANEGQAAPSAKTIALVSGGAIFRSGITFDAQGNLWVSDAGNNRVLRFPASVLGTHATNEPSADLVLGQVDFVSNQIPPSAGQSTCGTSMVTSQRCGRSFLVQPSGLAFDPKGRLFITDNVNRVLVYAPPFSIVQLASRLLGVVLPTKDQPIPPVINESTLGAVLSGGGVVPPADVFFVGNNPYVVDTGNARILG